MGLECTSVQASASLRTRRVHKYPWIQNLIKMARIYCPPTIHHTPSLQLYRQLCNSHTHTIPWSVLTLQKHLTPHPTQPNVLTYLQAPEQNSLSLTLSPAMNQQTQPIQGPWASGKTGGQAAHFPHPRSLARCPPSPCKHPT